MQALVAASPTTQFLNDQAAPRHPTSVEIRHCGVDPIVGHNGRARRSSLLWSTARRHVGQRQSANRSRRSARTVSVSGTSSHQHPPAQQSNSVPHDGQHSWRTILSTSSIISSARPSSSQPSRFASPTRASMLFALRSAGRPETRRNSAPYRSSGAERCGTARAVFQGQGSTTNRHRPPLPRSSHQALLGNTRCGCQPPTKDPIRRHLRLVRATRTQGTTGRPPPACQ